MTALPSFAEFSFAAQDANIVALCAQIAFDHETAVTLADRFVSEPEMFLLESAAAGPASRYSFLGFDPLWTWTYDLSQPSRATFVSSGRKEQLAFANPLHELRKISQRHKLKTVYPKAVRLGGPDVAELVGPVGFFGYDVAFALEPVLGKPRPKQLGMSDAFFFFPQNFLILDHLARRLVVARLVDLASANDPLQAFEAGSRKLSQLLKRLTSVHVPPPLELRNDPLDYEAFSFAVDRPEFERRVGHCLEQIRAGEIFQIQIGNRLSLKTEARPFDVFRHLRMLNPSPYMFFYKVGEHHVFGASPEMMVGVEGRTVTHRPIAGTRRRTWEAGKDLKMRRELVESEKERAEHVMLVDLARNDIGRVAAPGTVKVEELMTVEEYSHVFHMVSQVTGTLKQGQDAFAAMEVAFPNGTVTGASKIRAMQLINELETMSREFYAGSLALFDSRGGLRSTLLIRTIHMAHGLASTQASAGIVYDSAASDEWLETRNKMAACLLAMQNTL